MRWAGSGTKPALVESEERGRWLTCPSKPGRHLSRRREGTLIAEADFETHRLRRPGDRLRRGARGPAASIASTVQAAAVRTVRRAAFNMLATIAGRPGAMSTPGLSMLRRCVVSSAGSTQPTSDIPDDSPRLRGVALLLVSARERLVS
jgi:hypothetical protein